MNLNYHRSTDPEYNAEADRSDQGFDAIALLKVDDKRCVLQNFFATNYAVKFNHAERVVVSHCIQNTYYISLLCLYSSPTTILSPISNEEEQ